jgi:hypothetical protein
MPSCTNFSVWIKNQHYEVKKFCNDVVNLIQYSVSEGYNHVMNIFKDANGSWCADVKNENLLVNEIGSAIEYYEAH